LWWVSSQGDDVAYIARPGNAYLAWATDKWKPGHADFVGKRLIPSMRRCKRWPKVFRSAAGDSRQRRTTMLRSKFQPSMIPQLVVG
jgi:hypothetical protein